LGFLMMQLIHDDARQALVYAAIHDWLAFSTWRLDRCPSKLAPRRQPFSRAFHLVAISAKRSRAAHNWRRGCPWIRTPVTRVYDLSKMDRDGL
jgi:hypothetical protein